jgi:DNA-binding Xre family transcriptional regulator
LWTGARRPLGYGALSVLHAHRVAYELVYGKIPPDLIVLHICDNPPCVNPAHLRVGTRSENTRDMYAKGRHGGRQRRTRQAKAARTGSVQIRLRELAEIKQLNIGKIARLTGISEGTLRRMWYNEAIYVELDVLGALADLLKIEPGELFESSR